MNPARYIVRIHASIFCLSTIFALALFAFGVIERSNLFLATLFLFVFGESVLASQIFLTRSIDIRKTG